MMMVRMMIDQPQLPTTLWIHLRNREDRHREDLEPAVVDDEIQPGRDFLEALGFLRADVARALDGRGRSGAIVPTGITTPAV